MPQISLVEFLLHFSTIIAIFFPLLVLIRIRKHAPGKFSNAITWTLIGFFPVAIYHFLESLWYFNLNLLPPEDTLTHIAIDHLVVILTFISFGSMLLWVYAHFIRPIYASGKR